MHWTHVAAHLGAETVEGGKAFCWRIQPPILFLWQHLSRSFLGDVQIGELQGRVLIKP